MCEIQEHNHDTIVVRGIPIDAKLAPLINILWSIGIRTIESCQEVQNHPLPIPIATISFETPDDATKFINLLAASSPQLRNDLLYLDDTPSDRGFRCYIWYQGSTGTGFAQLFPTVTLEMPTDHIETATTDITRHLSWVALSAAAAK